MLPAAEVMWDFRTVRRAFGTRGAVRTGRKLDAIRTRRAIDTGWRFGTRRHFLWSIGPWRPAPAALVHGSLEAGAWHAVGAGRCDLVAVARTVSRVRPFRVAVRVAIRRADGLRLVGVPRPAVPTGGWTKVAEDGHALGDDLAIAHDPADAHTGVGQRHRCVLG